MLLAALEATLQLYRQGRSAELPALAALSLGEGALSQRATRLGLLLQERGVEATVVECEGQVGGGALPLVRLPSRGVALPGHAAAALSDALREGRVADGELGPLAPVLSIVRDERVTLDVRCIADRELEEAADAVALAVEKVARRGEGPFGSGSKEPEGSGGATLEIDATEV
jgi:L-seryl-tRNA(Ser) seleniumtransferase